MDAWGVVQQEIANDYRFLYDEILFVFSKESAALISLRKHNAVFGLLIVWCFLNFPPIPRICSAEQKSPPIKFTDITTASLN